MPDFGCEEIRRPPRAGAGHARRYGRRDPAATGISHTERSGTMSARSTTMGQTAPIVANEVYNVLSSLTDKLEGLAAYDKYERDGHVNDAIWSTLRAQDEQAV